LSQPNVSLNNSYKIVQLKRQQRGRTSPAPYESCTDRHTTEIKGIIHNQIHSIQGSGQRSISVAIHITTSYVAGINGVRWNKSEYVWGGGEREWGSPAQEQAHIVQIRRREDDSQRNETDPRNREENSKTFY
jgi:hypothetical protein